MSYHLRALLAFLLLVCAITGAAVFVTQRNAEAAHRVLLEERFQNRIALLVAAQEMQLAAVKDKCLTLSRSVRIRAALEDDDFEALYRNATDELRGVLQSAAASSQESDDGDKESSLPRADLLRFVDAHGALLSPTAGERDGDDVNAAPAGRDTLDRQLAALAPKLKNLPARQIIGYLAGQPAGRVANEDGSNRSGGSNPASASPTPVLEQIVATAITDPTTGNFLGVLVLGFPTTDRAGAVGKNGIWFDGTLHLPPTIPEEVEERAALAKRLAETVRQSPETGHFPVELAGVPHLLFYQALQTTAPFAPAYQVGLYPLAESLRQQRALLGQIIAWGGLVLAGGFALSLLLARRLSAPVAQLAAGAVENLAGRQRAEEALRQSEEQFRRIFDNAVEGFYLAAADGRYLNMNPALARIYGYGSPAEAIATMKEGSGIYVAPGRYAEFHQILKRDSIVTAFESEIERPDGSRIWVSENARALRDAAGELIEYEGTLTDISARKRAEAEGRALNARLESALDELKETQNQVIQQERLRALGEMASGIAHDFNNALMPILGFSELLLRMPAVLDERETALKYLQTINTSARDAGNVVSRLREFYRAREEDEAFGPVDLAALVPQAADLTQPKWKDQAQAAGITIDLRTELPEAVTHESAPLTVAGNESALREILTNLIFNAVDALPRGGTITLRARHEMRRGQEWGVLEVSDTGVGMSEETRRRCLDPFFSTKGERGTGLGLAMVFGIVQRHHGSLEIDTKLGQGSTFRVRLPIQATVAAPVPLASAAINGNGRALRVLIVDDEPQVRDTIASYLEGDGHTFVCAADAHEALAQFRERTDAFDIVVTDQAMPGMSGEQLARTVKEINADVPIILLTGFGCFMEAEEKRRSGVDILASKPITLRQWRESLDKACDLVPA